MQLATRHKWSQSVVEIKDMSRRAANQELPEKFTNGPARIDCI